MNQRTVPCLDFQEHGKRIRSVERYSDVTRDSEGSSDWDSDASELEGRNAGGMGKEASAIFCAPVPARRAS